MRIRFRSVVWAPLLMLAIACASAAAPTRAATPPAPAAPSIGDAQLISLGDSLDPFLDAFAAVAGRPRFVALLSPT